MSSCAIEADRLDAGDVVVVTGPDATRLDGAGRVALVRIGQAG